MERWLLTNVPTFWLAVLMVAVGVGLSLLALVIVRKKVEHDAFEAHHDVAGFLIAVVGVIYAVLLAFVVVIQWEQFRTAEDTAGREASSIGDLYRDAVALGPAGTDLRAAVAGYAHQVAYVEWPYMANHQAEDAATDVYRNRMWNAVTTLHAAGEVQSEFVRRAVDDVTTANEGRRTRIEESTTELPLPLWAVLLLGGVMTIGFALFFNLTSFKAQAMMVGILAAMIALSLFVILTLDLPFTGDVAATPTQLKDEINEFCSYNFVNPAQVGNCSPEGAHA